MPKKVKKKENTDSPKAPLETIIIPSPPVVPFNLSMEDTEENARIVLALRSLKSNAGWIFLMQLFAENKRVLSEMIIKKVDVEGKALTETQADEARYKYGYLAELMEKPDYFLKKLAPHSDPIDELDPYHQTPTDTKKVP